MANPTYRDLTKRFQEKRRQFRSDTLPAEVSQSNSNNGRLPLIGTQLRDPAPSIVIADLPPVWMELLESVDADILKIQRQIGMLKEYHSQRQRVMFEDETSAEHDINIQETTRSITALFQGSKRKLQEIATKDLEKKSDDPLKKTEKAGYEDRTVRFNVMRSRATQIQELTKTFREAQRAFLTEKKKKEESGAKYIKNDSVFATLPDLTHIANGFDDEQLQRLEQMEMNATDRTQEILNIAKSVHELATLFQELSVLVVEQGSLLDRIDYNVEQTLDNLGKAKKEIDKANVHQKRSRTALCIIVLIMLILVMGFILVLKQLA